MKISIITPTFNSEKSIQDCFNSICVQSYSNIEHIVIDGGSTDGTIQCIKKNLDRISVFVTESDSGIYDAINKGILKVTGDIIGLLHSDDVLYDCDVLKTIAEKFVDPMVDFIYGDLIYTSNDSHGRIFRYWKAGQYKSYKVRMGWMPPHPTIYMRKNLLYKVGFYDLKYKISSDYDLILRLLLLSGSNFHYIPRPLVKMRVGGVSNRSLKNIAIKSYEDYLIIKKYQIGGFFTLLCKNFSKLTQLFIKI